MTSYGRKGGEGPTRGKKATNYVVELPDGTSAKKHCFDRPAQPTGYAYSHDGVWYVAAIDEPGNARFATYTPCIAVEA